MKILYPLFVVLFLISNGFGQNKYHEVIEMYEKGFGRGRIKKIEHWKRTGNRLGLAKVSYWGVKGFLEEEEIYKNGYLDVEIKYNRNGTKWSETIYKKGKFHSRKRWNDDGSLKE